MSYELARSVPAIRCRPLNDAPPRPEGRFVLYWMVAARRTRWNFGLQRAVEWSRELGKPVVILEGLRCDYPWASDRFHNFLLEGMADNAASLRDSGVFYYPYIEPKPGAGKGLVAAFAGRACVVVTDDYPVFFIPRMLEAAARKLDRLLEAVDSNGLLPMRAADRTFPTALSFRRYLQKHLAPHLSQFPKPNPLARLKLPRPRGMTKVLTSWPLLFKSLLADDSSELRSLPVDHSVPPVSTRGGSVAAQRTWRRFLKEKYRAYAEERNRPESDAVSNLSPYLHFGHISSHQVFAELMKHEDWSLDHVRAKAGGSRGWWGVSESGEGFLDQLVTWRELGFNMCWTRDDYDRYASLPDWARATLAEHASDPRPHVYSLEQFEEGGTHDALWNAAQMQLVREGRIHNYLRMLWGKKILEWSPSPQKALRIMIELNNKYALDGRDPNSYSGIFWCLGRYDRPWGPERPVFGKIRYMSSANTARKVSVRRYIRAYAPSG